VKSVPPRKRTSKNSNPLIKSEKQLLTYRIPECVSHYFGALTNPFNTEAGACLPCDLFPLPSLKTRVFVRGSLALGPNGFGFIAATPTVANDAAVIQHTDSLSVGASGTVFNAYTNLVNKLCTQNVYTSAQLTGGFVGQRIVAYGIRVKYVGKLADRNGVVTCYEDPDGGDTRTKSFSSLNSDPYSSLARVGAEAWDCQVCHSGPVRPLDLEFSYLQYPNGTAAPLIVAMSGLAGDLYEFEYYQHSETIGTLVPGKSKSHGEAQLFGKLVETVKGETANHPLMPMNAPSLWEGFKMAFADTLPRLYNAGKGAAQLITGDYMGGLSSVAQAIAGPQRQGLTFPRESQSGQRERNAERLLLR
jgi:hypothetical protein